MKRIGFSFYSVFVVGVAFAVAGIATLAQNLSEGITAAPGETVLAQSGDLASRAASKTATVAVAADPSERLVGADEATYRQRQSALIASLLKLEISEDDQGGLKAVREALAKRDPATAKSSAGKVSDRAARKLADWLILRAGYGRIEDYQGFLADNPLWPDRALIERRLEQSLFIDGGSALNIINHFKERTPKSDAGFAALASAHLALGKADKAKEYAGKAWCGGGIAASREQAFLQRFKQVITQEHHRCRLDRLLVDNLRWTSQRKRRAQAVRRLIKLLDEKVQKKATARLSGFLRQKVARKWLKAVPEAQRKDDWGFHFQYVQHLRLIRKHKTAWALLKKVPADRAKLINPDAWWEERHANALNALKAKSAKLAYELVADIRPDDVNAAKDQAFFAGWVALRKLAKPKLALEHFKHMLSLVDGPLSSSKAHYWLGRTHQALKQQEAARKHYEAGAAFKDTFHGLLAKQTLNLKDSDLALPLPATADEAMAEAFVTNEAVRAAVIARRVGLPRGHVLKFFRSIARGLKSEAEIALLAQLVSDLGDGQLEVRTGKVGIARGFNLYIYSYPLSHLPSYEPLRTPPERAVVLAIARQESEFNKRIVSGAGARGVLQVMPITARHVCQQYKIKCKLKDLLDKPAHNARLATAYIADRTDEFTGSYILTFTGYNAGPGRTRQWLREIGDPRAKNVRALDWIYRIPFEETRLYAQKVLSNVQVYRARLGLKDPVRLLDDMKRGS